MTSLLERVSGFTERRGGIAIALIGVLLALAWYPMRSLFPFDDTYITFRYAEHVAHGLGIVWNPGGEHTEGYTNFLFMLLLVPFKLIGIDLLTAAQCIGILSVILSGILIYRLIRLGSASSVFALFGSLLYLLDPLTWMNAYSGLETSLFVLLLLSSLWAFARNQQRYREEPREISYGRTILPYILALLAMLVRPEGALMALVLWLTTLFMRKSQRAASSRIWFQASAPFVIGFVIPALIYLLWKKLYFGDVLPNSFYVKVAQPNASGMSVYQGGGTLKLFYLGLFYLPLLSIFSLIGRRHKDAQRDHSIPVVALLWCTGLTAFYLFSLLLQPQYERFTHSMEAMLSITAAIGASSLTRRAVRINKEERRINRTENKDAQGTLVSRPTRTYSTGPSINFSFLIINSLLLFLLVFHVVRAYTTRGGTGYFASNVSYNARYIHIAARFRAIPHHDKVTLAWGDAGVLPYYSGMRSLDVVGLNTNEIARAKSTDEVLRIVARARPEMILLPLDATSPDSCRRVFRSGHGLIGSGYWRLMDEPELRSYKPIAMFPLKVYDLDLFVDTLSPHYRDIIRTLTPSIGPDSLVLSAPACIQ